MAYEAVELDELRKLAEGLRLEPDDRRRANIKGWMCPPAIEVKPRFLWDGPPLPRGFLIARFPGPPIWARDAPAGSYEREIERECCALVRHDPVEVLQGSVALTLRDRLDIEEAARRRIQRRLFFAVLKYHGEGMPGSLRTKRLRKKRAKALGVTRPIGGWC